MDLSKYYEEICKTPLLTKAEEVALFKVYKDPATPPALKKKAGDRIVTANLRFVFKLAKMRSRGDPNQFEELISAGNEGLLVALDKFDHNSGYRYTTYANFWIVQRQLKEQSKMRIVSLPVYKQQLASKIQKIQEATDEKLTAQQLHEMLPDKSLKDIEELMQTKYLTFYFEDLGNDNFYCDEFLNTMLASMDANLLQQGLATLSSLERNVVSETFGFLDGEEKTLHKVGKVLNIKAAEAKEALETGLSKLKEFFKAHEKEWNVFDDIVE